MPKYFGTSIIAIITLNVAIGYELNVSTRQFHPRLSCAN